MNKGIGGHQSARAGKDEWLTPPELLEKLGVFDLDPCAPVKRPWSMAGQHFTINDNGLLRNWQGRVWCNPPYGREAAKWLARCAEHGNAIALIFARTETEMFFKHVWRKATAVLFLEGRLYFHHVDGTRAAANSGAPSVLIAYNAESADRLRQAGIPGQFIELYQQEKAPVRAFKVSG